MILTPEQWATLQDTGTIAVSADDETMECTLCNGDGCNVLIEPYFHTCCATVEAGIVRKGSGRVPLSGRQPVHIDAVGPGDEPRPMKLGTAEVEAVIPSEKVRRWGADTTFLRNINSDSFLFHDIPREGVSERAATNHWWVASDLYDSLDLSRPYVVVLTDPEDKK